MGIINQLDYATANLVAAGEVIERPASVVKELIENSVDAGATRITLEIKNGGVSFIRVTDNGKGMAHEDVPLCILRHATSKIKTGADLEAIMTLGFRGEALASVAAVAKLRIRSKRPEDALGTELFVEPGRAPQITEAGMSDGTTVIVEDLFAAIPARLKFLKKDLTETNAVQAVFEKIALSCPNIAMTLIVDGNKRVFTAGDGKRLSAIYGIMGADFASKLIELPLDADPYGYADANIKVTGYLGTPENVRSNRNYQCFFVNGRYVRSRCLQAALEQGYATYIPAEKYPSCVLYLELPASEVDVNVHPTKLEVKFAREKAVFERVYFAVRGLMEKKIPTPALTMPKNDPARAFIPIEERSAPQENRFVYNNQKNAKRSQITWDDVAARLMKSETSAPSTSSSPSANAALHVHSNFSAIPKDSPSSDIQPASQQVYEAVAVNKASDIPKNEIQTNIWEDIPASLNEHLTARHDGEIMAPPPQKMIFDSLPPEIAALEPHPSPKQRKDKQAAMDALLTKSDAPAENAFSSDDPTSKQEKTFPFRILGEAFLSYVFVETGNRVMIIDKHAAHERIIFEDLRAGRNNAHVSRQMLLIPIDVSLSPEEMAAFKDYEADIASLGFEFCTPNTKTVSVSAIPIGIETTAVADMLITITGRLASGTGSVEISRDLLFDKALFQASCKAAIKAGRDEDIEHIKWIVSKLLTLDDIKVCPHGRPVAFELTKAQLERQFKRS